MSASTTATIFQDIWDHFQERDRQYLFLVLLSFLASFGFIRLSTRLMRSPKVPWWPGSVVSDSGVHVHHLVFGIVAMMLAGTCSFTVESSFWYGVYAVVFGIGMGLTIDEYALWSRCQRGASPMRCSGRSSPASRSTRRCAWASPARGGAGGATARATRARRRAPTAASAPTAGPPCSRSSCATRSAASRRRSTRRG